VWTRQKEILSCYGEGKEEASRDDEQEKAVIAPGADDILILAITVVIDMMVDSGR
jgi:hypothetical protein